MKHGFSYNETNGLLTLSVPSFDETGICLTAFTTRKGGVSKPPIDTMNLGFGRGDDRESVLRNYEILGETLSFPHEKIIAFTQVHKNDVCVATLSDAGEAYLPDKREFDAIITNIKNLPLATYHADCVPIFLLDPILGVCGVAHAGWRGCALNVPAVTVSKMKDAFGVDPKNVIAAIGPSIAKCCFECGPEVRDAMMNSYGENATPYITDDKNGKFHIDLAGLCAESLISAGVQDENITLSDECTFCKSDIFWSHRATGGIRGAMAAIIMLQEEI